MALTRKMLKGMGIEDEKIDTIIEAHSETVDALKKERDEYKESADKLEAVTKERDELKAGGDFKQKYEDEKKAFENYKNEVTAKETRTAKESAVRAYLESKNITGGNLDIAMRGLSAEIDAAELDGDKIKDTKQLDELIGGTFKGLVVTTSTKGVQTSTPATQSNGGKLTREDIFKRDDKGRYIMSTAERQKALAENPDLMR